MGASADQTARKPRGKIRIKCKVPGCGKRRWVDPSAGAKYCAWHAVERNREWGRANLAKCQYVLAAKGRKKERCGREFVPLHSHDRMCEDHALELNTEHRVGECAVCGEQKRLYQNADRCTRCLRALPTSDEQPERQRQQNGPVSIETATDDQLVALAQARADGNRATAASAWQTKAKALSDEELTKNLDKFRRRALRPPGFQRAVLAEADRRGIDVPDVHAGSS